MKTFLTLGRAALLLVLLPLVALAQVAPPQPYNTPFSDPGANTPTATTLKSFTAAAPATADSSIINNLLWSGIQCKYNRTAQSGSPSTVVSIMAYDAASATFTTWLSTSAQTATGESTLQIYPGIQTSSLPSGMVALNLALPRYFKVRVATTGSNTTHTAKLGCDLLAP